MPRRYADLVGSFVTLALGVAIVAMMLLTLASSATAHGTGDDNDALVTTNALTGTAVGTTTFATVFVVASTFAFVVARRRRELALLRAVGATPRQVRGLVLREAFLVSVPAGLVGCVLGRLAAPWLVEWLGDRGLAPEWLTMRHAMWPLYTAFAVGVVVALSGAAVAARQAARVRPVEALRQAALDTPGASRVRLALGAVFLVAAVGYLVVTAIATPDEAIHRKHRTLAPMLVIPGIALLAPALIGPPLRALGRLTRGRGPVALELARSGVLALPRRAAATVAPVLMTVGLSASLLGGTETVEAAKVRDAERRMTAEYVVDGTAPASELRALPGVDVATPVATTVKLTPAASVWVELDVLAVDPREIATVMDIRVKAGSLADLTDDAIAVPDDWAQRTVGAVIPARTADGTERTLRIAAVLEQGIGTPALLTAAHAPPGARADTLVNVRAGTDQVAADQGVRAVAGRHAATVRTDAEWAAASQGDASDDRKRHAVYVVLGIAVLYAGVAIANTSAMSTADQAATWRALRLAGATRAQVLRTAAVEAALMLAMGVLLGALATAATLGPLWMATAQLAGPATPDLPWVAVGLTACAAAAIALPAALFAALRATGRTGAPTGA